ncbi:MAG: pyruvate formate-lyase [Ruminococcaceae bacterium]|nr:pyruvate formate-lyase [Oscillospiraceae bacterium]
MNTTLYNFYIQDRSYRETYRKTIDRDLAHEFSEAGLSDEERVCRRFEILCEAEEAHIHDFEKIVMLRTVKNIPDCFTEEEWQERRERGFIHENGYVSNLCPNYARVISSGLLSCLEGADEYRTRVINAIISLTDKYLAAAKTAERSDLVEIFTQIPRYGARNFREALQFFRILHFALWLEGDYHNTVGRFDRFMYPYFKADMDAGVYDEDSALELIEDFFISFNKDSDLYFGQQQGDNGQSLVLGGIDESGKDCYNLLSKLCLRASMNLKVIDPKINLRVSKSTPLSVYEECTNLTKAGLGFPQYSNDDVVIPALEKLGYSHEDAVNYVVAACWEFIIPGCGNDIPNICALNLPMITDAAIRETIPTAKDFDEVLFAVRDKIFDECEAMIKQVNRGVLVAPSPFMDILRDGKKYNNFGIHGCGIAAATDALYSVKQHIFDNKDVTPEALIEALDTNFENAPELLHLLRYETPKMGQGRRLVDMLAGFIMDDFADALKGHKNTAGGRFRAGTGTAMFYLWHASELGATADGRRAGEPFGANFSPSLYIKTQGPLSVIDSFTSNKMAKVMNGGPLTLEFDSAIFNGKDSLRKVASLVKYFIERGGHQLQLNSVSLEAMKAAQENPELYKNLVVRIWGWSAYFVELDKEFQDHVMMRREHTV